MLIENPDEFIQASIVNHGCYEKGLLDSISTFLIPGGVFLDVGANIGQYTLLAASRGMIVHAFEPVQRLAARLAANVRINRLQDRVKTVAYAISNQDGSSPFHLAHRKDDGSHSLLAGVIAHSKETVMVETRTLDSYLEMLRIRPSVVKIDVEGAEALVLDGAAKMLSGNHPPVIAIETGDRLAIEVGETAASVISRLFANGYIVFQVDDWSGILREVRNATQIPTDVCNYLAVPATHEQVSVLRESIIQPLPTISTAT